jgi:hypothetical protein
MRTIQLEDSAIDLILWVLSEDKSKYESESKKIAAKICEQCQLGETEEEGVQ